MPERSELDREYAQRDAAYRAAGGRGALIAGGEETDEERAARETQEAEAERERVEREREAAEAALPDGARNALRAEREARRTAERDAREARQALEAASTERDRLAAAARERENAELGERERAERERDEAVERARQADERAQATALRSEVVMVGTRLNLHDPEVAYRLLDQSQVQRDANGHPTNVEALLKALLEAHPYLAKVAGASGVPRTPDGTGTGMTEDEKRKAAGNRLVRPRL